MIYTLIKKINLIIFKIIKKIIEKLINIYVVIKAFWVARTLIEKIVIGVVSLLLIGQIVISVGWYKGWWEVTTIIGVFQTIIKNIFYKKDIEEEEKQEEYKEGWAEGEEEINQGKVEKEREKVMGIGEEQGSGSELFREPEQENKREVRKKSSSSSSSSEKGARGALVLRQNYKKETKPNIVAEEIVKVVALAAQAEVQGQEQVAEVVVEKEKKSDKKTII